ncbi:hypothetical protein [Natronococcus wangiae]|uniref:hypothetical protein n=1 Tax=Natronococcus wangiae TaxID=3068275 RepID=UPI00273FC41D|nr:hypothetical protein [Natronococcus sp. AD5]
MISSATLEDALATYNEYRSPMATAELLETGGDAFVVRFEGPFCRMCCDYDYFEDLIYELEEHGEDPDALEVAEIECAGEEAFVVTFAGREPAENAT